ncbi:hypothetical protein [Vibrio phage vB_VpS_PG28]|nr:hypothetical protein [Vibrio phage vB_VpS_PG28]
MDKYFHSELKAETVDAVTEVTLQKHLNKSQVSIQPLDAEGKAVTSAVTGTVTVQAFPVGVSTPDAAYLQTVDVATATTVSLSGFFDKVTVTPTDLANGGVAGYAVITSQIVG